MESKLLNENEKEVPSTIANKMIKNLEEDKEYWLDYESNARFYVAANNEEPVIPEYDFEKVSKTLAEIDEKILKLKHALNLHNATSEVQVGDELMTIDMILVRMAQLNRRKSTLDVMRKALPKTRVESSGYGKNAVPEYRYINFDQDAVKAEYEAISNEILALQLALDTHNQTQKFVVE